MTSVAIVVQRCHPKVVGGSETLAWEYARLLAAHYRVEVLTTTAVDHIRWDNALAAGVEQRDGIAVRRFPVTLGRGGMRWSLLFEELKSAFAARQSPDWSLALQEDWIRNQGPYSEGLLSHLERHGGDYEAILFITYLYPTAYFGLQVVPPARAFLVPTLHDEPPAYLPVFRDRAVRVRSLLWLTEAEGRLGEKLWGDVSGEVIAMPVAMTPATATPSSSPYALYCGRIEEGKGCKDLVAWFLAFQEADASPCRLVLTGQNLLPLPRHRAIDFRGFVADDVKRSLMAGAAVFIMPSAYESFSLATLEAMAQGTPVLVNGACDVLAEHVARSGGGRVYHDRPSFARHLRELLGDATLRRQIGDRGRVYVRERFREEVIRDRLVQAIRAA